MADPAPTLPEEVPGEPPPVVPPAVVPPPVVPPPVVPPPIVPPPVEPPPVEPPPVEPPPVEPPPVEPPPVEPPPVEPPPIEPPPAPIDTSFAIRNLAQGSERCLTMSTVDGVSVGFAACSGSDAQRWRMERANNENFRVKNVLAASQSRDVCLRAAPAAPGAVSMSSCGGADYPTTRLWRAAMLDPNGAFTMLNKHWADTNKGTALQSTEDALAMLPEAGQPAARWTYEGEVPTLMRRVGGTDRVLLITGRFTGQTANPAEPIRKAVFGDGDDFSSLAHYLKLASRGKFGIEGTMLTDVDLGDFPKGCDSVAIRAQAKAAAKARGVDAGKFNLLFVDFPSNRECRFSGLAGSPGAWILSNGSGHGYWMWTHEFGHGLGVHHPDSLQHCPVKDGAVVIGNGCVTGGIDDPTDTVGGGGRRMYPVDYQLFTGWLSEEDVPAIVKPGTYRLAPLWSTLPGKQGYRLPRGDGSALVLEFRRPQLDMGKRGTFEDWPDTSPFVNGVTVRIMRHPNTVSIKNTLVDATPGSADGMKDAPLMPGKSIVDTVSGRRITVLSADESGAVVQVELAR
ncbi:carbohydrate-binding protein [Burkholderia anthina]|nr:carbohydrate-binding protein [Burkholderia anthina]KVH14694.1 carbohydrate-binding protein [Burkholderia anthina]KVM85554.1 carbohydrate-binding protein [Burkholderia anthina]KVX32839.1 carbohydrate-binding protein [Burkholderia anthina]